eukprot:scaffold25478_cov101-Isochrysis_galbana.AAC.1
MPMPRPPYGRGGPRPPPYPAILRSSPGHLGRPVRARMQFCCAVVKLMCSGRSLHDASPDGPAASGDIGSSADGLGRPCRLSRARMAEATVVKFAKTACRLGSSRTDSSSPYTEKTEASTSSVAESGTLHT